MSHSPNRRSQTAEALLWLALFAPVLFLTNAARSPQDVLSNPLGGTAGLRGGAPILLLAVALSWWRPRLGRVSGSEAFLLAYVTWALLSTVWSVVPFATFLRAFTLLVAYLSAIVLGRLHESERINSFMRLGVVIQVLLVVVAVEAVVAPGRAWTTLDAFDQPRLIGLWPFIHPDLLGLLAAAGTIMTISNNPWRWQWRRGVQVGLILIDLGILVLTRARTAVVLVAVGCFVLSYPHWRPLLSQRRYFIPVASAVAVLGVATVLVSPLIVGYFFRGQDLASVMTLTGRTVSWSHALSLWEQRPILGFGYYSGHRFMLAPYYASIDPGGIVADIDSMWVTTLLDVGVVGIILIVLSISSSAWAMWNAYAEVDPFVHGRRALFVVGIMSSFVNPGLETTGYNQILLCLVMLGAPRLLSLPTFARAARGRSVPRGLT